jgi:hypothetical protein
MQRFNLTSFWARYGRERFDSTEFSRAIKRLPASLPEGPWIAGGAVRRLVSGLPQDSDYDFFFANAEQLAAFKSRMEDLHAVVLGETDFNISYRIPEKDRTNGPLKVQAIKLQYFSSVELAIESFDFSLCQCAYDGTDLVFGPYTLYDLASKRLIPGKITFGVSSLRRIIKYTKQGYSICGGGLATMLQQVVDDPSIIQSKIEYID